MLPGSDAQSRTSLKSFLEILPANSSSVAIRIEPGPPTAKPVQDPGQNALLRRTDRRFALLNNERCKEFQRGGTVVDPDVNLASINIERLSRFIGSTSAPNL